VRDLQERGPVVPALSRLSRRRLVVPLVAVAVIVADQVTKTLALHHLQPGVPHHVIGPSSWLLTYNSGAAFSLGRGVTPFIEAGVVVLIVALALFARRAQRSASWPALIALGMLLGGALSNLGDRVFRNLHGAVVDFIQAVTWFPIFNVADSAVTIGVILLILTWGRSPAGVGPEGHRGR
jgi:signal peptidase II